MKNLFAYDFTNNTIVASKTTLKKAGNPTMTIAISPSMCLLS